MDPSVASGEDHDPAVRDILERAGRLTTDEVVNLARAYRASGGRTVRGTVLDRRRVVDIARRRSGRADQIRGVEAAIATALGKGRSGVLGRSLRKLGILDEAEQAVIDAALAVLLRDRLGQREAQALREPWDSLT